MYKPVSHQVSNDQFVSLDKDQCVDCGLCVSFCEPGVFAFDNDWTFTFSPELCVECELCGDVCPLKAISLKGKVMIHESIQSQS